MSFKDISYPALWQPRCSVDWNHLWNIERRNHEEQSCEIVLTLDQWFRRRCRLHVFLIWSSGSLFAQQSVTICAIFGRGYQDEHFCEIILNLDQWFR